MTQYALNLFCFRFHFKSSNISECSHQKKQQTHFELAAADYCPFFITAVDKNYGYLALKSVSSLNNTGENDRNDWNKDLERLNYDRGWQLPPCCTISCTTFATNAIQKQFRFTDIHFFLSGSRTIWTFSSQLLLIIQIFYLRRSKHPRACGRG